MARPLRSAALFHKPHAHPFSQGGLHSGQRKGLWEGSADARRGSAAGVTRLSGPDSPRPRALL